MNSAEGILRSLQELEGVGLDGGVYSHWLKGVGREGGTSYKTEIVGDVGRVGDRIKGFWSSDSPA